MKHTYLYEGNGSDDEADDSSKKPVKKTEGQKSGPADRNQENSSGSTGHNALILIAVLSFLVLIFCIVRLVIHSISSYNDKKNIEKLVEKKGEAELTFSGDEATGHQTAAPSSGAAGNTGEILPEYSELYTMNSDLAGWISIDATSIDYPVMLTPTDEEFYLHRNYEKNDSDEGLPFMDSRCSILHPGTNLMIYGHNMKNGDMFADLLKYQDYDYYEKHKTIRFDTVYEKGIYEIIAVFRSRVAYRDENTFRFYNFIEADSEADFRYYIENISRLSLYQADCTAEYPDRLLTLVTCEYTEDDGRFVVVAKKIR